MTVLDNYGDEHTFEDGSAAAYIIEQMSEDKDKLNQIIDMGIKELTKYLEECKYLETLDIIEKMRYRRL